MPKMSVNEVNLHYEVSGAGPSVVLCHGYSGSHQDWMYQIPVLSQHYQAIAIDTRGHGSSDAPSSPDAYSIPIFASDVYTLLDHLGITKCCFIGHSMGGFTGLQLAVDYPQFFTSLVLVDASSVPVIIPGQAELRAKLDEIARRDGTEAAFEYNAQHNPVVQKRFEKYPKLREVARRKTRDTSVDGYIYSWQAISQWLGVTARLGEISAPTLVIVGEEDVAFHQPTEVLAKAIPNARRYVVPQATHYPHEENPQAFNELLITFLTEVGAG